MVLEYHFEGLIIPVFTCFESDPRFEKVKVEPTGLKEVLEFNKNNTYFSNYLSPYSHMRLSLDHIKLYSQVIVLKHLKGVLVNGIEGEHSLMSLRERKMNCEAWARAAKEHDLNLLVNVGGSSLSDVLELARHAESLNADGIVCLPDPFFRPTCVIDLIAYLISISNAAPNTPLFYHHIPAFTGIDLPMNEFLKEGKESLATLTGLIYSSADLEEVVRCKNVDKAFTILIGTEKIFCEAQLLGFKSVVLPTLNFWPEFFFKIIELIEESKHDEARDHQKIINEKLDNILQGAKPPTDWLLAMKCHMQSLTGIPVGLSRLTIISDLSLLCDKTMKK